MSKVINFKERREKLEKNKLFHPVKGWIVWLRCKKCQLTEYTEIRMSEGRIHKCGTLVDEYEVEIDVRAELTISLRNSELIKKFIKTIDQKSLLSNLMSSTISILRNLEDREKEYRNRLSKMTTNQINPYSEDWNPKEKGMDIKIARPIDLLLTAARRPELYFTDL